MQTKPVEPAANIRQKALCGGNTSPKSLFLNIPFLHTYIRFIMVIFSASFIISVKSLLVLASHLCLMVIIAYLDFFVKGFGECLHFVK